MSGVYVDRGLKINNSGINLITVTGICSWQACFSINIHLVIRAREESMTIFLPERNCRQIRMSKDFC